jgi:type VI secretion system secreted protein Hcp
MAVDMFLKLSNGLEGESRDKSRPKQIDVLAWSWGMSQSGTTHVGGGGGAGKANFQDISVTKWVDKSSPKLMQACAKGTHIDTGELVVRKAGDTPLEYIKIELEDIMVTSVSTGGSGGEDRLTENVSLNFCKFKVSYQEQDDKGAKKGGAVEFGWNIAENATA